MMYDSAIFPEPLRKEALVRLRLSDPGGYSRQAGYQGRNAMVNTPHDALFKTFMSHPETVGDFLGIHLPAELLALCDLKTLKLASGSFIDESLRASYSDVLWSLQTCDGVGYVYALIEHQSSPDKHMAFRLMRYAFAAMQRHLEAGHDTLPLVIPMLFYHGEKSPYPFSMRWLDAFAEPEIARVLYDGVLPLVDLTVLSDDDIMGHRRIALLEFLQKNIRRRDLMEMTENLLRLLRAGYTTDSQFRALIHYLAETGRTTQPEAFFRQLAGGMTPREEKMMKKKLTLMEWAEIQHDEGRNEGEQQTTLKIARALISHGVALKTIAQTTGLSIEELAEINR
jgi:conserved hypothetical protein (putative transposase or invertase)